MRAIQSFTASEVNRRVKPAGCLVASDAAVILQTADLPQHPRRSGAMSNADRRRPSGSNLAGQAGEGLLHDARNLIGTIGLYCDLLSLPGVLKPEHRRYSDELRHLGERSGMLIDDLMRTLLTGAAEEQTFAEAVPREGCKVRAPQMAEAESRARFPAVGLRGVVERCSGLLSRVASGLAIEFDFGPAAASPVRITEETVERILVNLVRNAAAAMRDPGDTRRPPEGTRTQRSERLAAKASSEGLGSIRITLGLLTSRVGEAKPWPFQHVRLSVEDAGCGMTSERVGRLLSDESAPHGSTHGIGFRVVRELVAASGGEIQLRSGPGAGTRVQIEWPVAASAVDTGAVERNERAVDVYREGERSLAAESRGRQRREQEAALASGTEGLC